VITEIQKHSGVCDNFSAHKTKSDRIPSAEPARAVSLYANAITSS
jgi:hypothetical protein